MTVLETDRLILRRFTLDDVEPLAAIYADPDITRFLGGPRTVEETRGQVQWAMEFFDQHGVGFLATVLKETGELIGRCGILLQIIDGDHYVEVAYGIAASHWGRGLATEAARALKEHGFRDHGYSRMISLVAPDNHASRRVAEKNGMHYDRDVKFKGHDLRLYLVERKASSAG
jgi:ribosomal-protein-alanine N-acetyltransferase